VRNAKAKTGVDEGEGSFLAQRPRASFAHHGWSGFWSPNKHPHVKTPKTVSYMSAIMFDRDHVRMLPSLGAIDNPR